MVTSDAVTQFNPRWPQNYELERQLDFEREFKILGQLFVYPLFVVSCVAGIFRPYYGLLGFYTFVFLEPEWNWRWSIPPGLNFQKYISLCLLIGVFLYGFKGNAFSGWLGWTVACIVAFLGLAWLSSIQTIDAQFTFFYLDIITKVIFLAVVAMRIVDTREKAIGLLWVIVLCQAYSAFRINEQYFQDGYSLYSYMRSWGFKGDNNLYSIFTIPAMAGALALSIHSKKLWHRGIAGFIAALQLHQMMLMESRGCMIGGLFMIALIIWLMPKTRFNIGAAIIGVIVGSILAGPPVIKEFTSSFESEGTRDSSADSRFKLWQAGLKITLDNPLLGVGPYAGQVKVPQYIPEYNGMYNKGLHNLVFEISTGCGIPALIFYLLFLLIPWWQAFWTYRREKKTMDGATAACLLSLTVGIPGYLVSSMFSSGALLESSYILVSCCAASLVVWQRTQDSETSEDALEETEEFQYFEGDSVISSVST